MCNIQTILVPAGAEYKAVKKGLRQLVHPPQLVAIPAGPQGLRDFLQSGEGRLLRLERVLLMGLGGSLSPKLSVGDGIVIEKIWTEAGEVFECDRDLTTRIAKQLGLRRGAGVTCDRVITQAQEKQALGDRYSADVVDMEGATLLRALPHHKVAILRVVSDDCYRDLPDISGAIAPDGSLKPIYLALNFARNPRSAIAFIRGSLQGLKTLENQTLALFGAPSSAKPLK